MNTAETSMIRVAKEAALREHNIRKRAVVKTNSTAAGWIQSFYKESQEVIKDEDSEEYFCDF